MCTAISLARGIGSNKKDHFAEKCYDSSSSSSFNQCASKICIFQVEKARNRLETWEDKKEPLSNE